MVGFNKKPEKMDEPNKCSYCQAIIDSDDFLNCHGCQNNVHIKCLKRPGTPGDLLGDVFFTFTCSNCASDKKEVFVRQKLPWLMVITLTIYNLSIQSKGLSHHGYFHWRTHITHFIDKNWNFLFDPGMKRKKKWTGTVSGTLSHNSPQFFASGQEYFQDSGWWKLTYNQTPKFYWKLYEQLSLKKQQLRNDRRNVEEVDLTELENILGADSKRTRKDEEKEGPLSRTLPYMGREPKKIKQQHQQSTSKPSTSQLEDNKTFNSVQSNLMDFLAANLSSGELLSDLPQIAPKDLLPLMSPTEQDPHDITDLWSPETPNLDYENDLKLFAEMKENDQVEDDGMANSSNDLDKYKPRVVQVTNFQECSDDPEENQINMGNIKIEPNSDSDSDSEQFEITCEKSLFTIKPKRDYPWKDDREEDDELMTSNENDNVGNIQLMSDYEERELFYKLKAILNVEKDYKLTVPCKIRRLYRKLCVRNIKRDNFKPIFNIDNYGNPLSKSSKPQLLDRYYQMIAGSSNQERTFYSRIIGSVQDEAFESPFTSRLLHPFIFRNAKSFPSWIKLMCELQYTVTGTIPTRATVDFCYVRPYHIAAVNGLLQQFFWPGIDMSECLSYPDFSVVALYKKLVVGCAFLVPDVRFNEAYISFMAVRPGWQRCGIASFMLYHLTQTCMGKDITLHVSATNPAICLYHKFGFKIEEVILDFYEKYLPPESTHSRHAFLLRMTK